MRFPRQNSARGAGRQGRRRSAGFAVGEILSALVVLVLCAGLVLTLAGRRQQRQNCDHCLRDLRVFSAAFAHYHEKHNTWPPSSDAEVALPPDLAEALKATDWFKGSPFGGNYGWVAPDPAEVAGSAPVRGWGGSGAVTLTAFSPSFPLRLDQSDLLYIDGELDDGNLATGQFRTGFNGWPVYFVEAASR
jgi:hypothetical protein